MEITHPVSPASSNAGLVDVDPSGLWCESGGFHIDPWGQVKQALITHGHADRARPGSRLYLCAAPCEPVLRERFGADVTIESLPYGEVRRIGEVAVSFHPAGHMLGSAQIRIEHQGEVWVVSGDYKLAPDPTCAPFEPVHCHTFVTEATFGLPIFRWADQGVVIASINDWWRANQERGRSSLLFAHPLGEAQRVLAALDRGIGPIQCHEAVERMNRLYRAGGVDLPESQTPADMRRALLIAPPSAKRSGIVSTGLVSGWMRIRGTRRHRSIDRGFVISSHADWPEINRAIEESGAERVLVSHGHRAPLVRWLQEHGKAAAALETRFEGDAE
jgi:putative mRNA 3-end processing factor